MGDDRRVWAPGWRRGPPQYPRCIACGQTRNPHKARGFCTTCYLQKVIRADSRWPRDLESCVRCRASRDAARYVARGLCASCYRECASKRTLSEWPSRYTKNDAVRVAQWIGATEAADRLGVEVVLFRSWCTGDVPDGEIDRVRALLAEVKPC